MSFRIESEGNANRILSVDVIRVLAVLAVILIHTEPFRQGGSRIADLLYVLINQMARFAVPVFFAVSGYMWGMKVREGISSSVTRKTVQRALLLFVVWCGIYLIPYNLSSIVEHGVMGPIKHTYWTLVELKAEPLRLLFEGTKVHLWFLVSLIWCVSIADQFLRRKWFRSLAVLAVVLYVIGVLAGSYANTPVGFELGFDTRNGPFFGLIFFVTGYVLSGVSGRDRWFMYGSALWATGCAAHFIEVFLLVSKHGISSKQVYVFGTYFMGSGMALIALSNQPCLQLPRLAITGRFVLGIYLCHFIFVDLLRPIVIPGYNALWELLYPLIVLLMSLLTTVLLASNSRTKFLVT